MKNKEKTYFNTIMPLKKELIDLMYKKTLINKDIRAINKELKSYDMFFIREYYDTKKTK